MLKFNTPEEVNQYFAGWHDFSEADRLKTIRDLKLLGTLGKVDHRATPSPFKCPINGFVLSRPCQLKQCQYYLDSTEDRNCLVNCLSRTKHGRLSAPEVAEVLNSSVSDINQVTNQAVCKIRKAIIKERVEKLVNRRYRYLPGHCVHCETVIQDELDLNLNPELVIEYGQYGWCSPDCRKAKPKWQFRIELEFGCHHRDAIWAAQTMSGLAMDEVDQIFDLEAGTAKGLRLTTPE
jgi:hypothetical protein